ncbi:MAG: hydrogenase maturation protease [Candidatus Aminicenantes bacterium]|nr:hydrogenase maturation protease [Candidatus Aminicenantes bacterium]NIM84358.1 hydrogenase maturation protease [Candidatus Aminicenantes bacterium]NIN23844.1 hydrogenase maturation protease [Candidatus Aminicenantes bacterium]NIN47560.1 hydrogenase maturation protease [Candidatus Aminicenantes bacterium]NIN90480.1 hydrogenase maturation protease [Candidatus Aminicenantes bacterium]
MKRKKMAVIGLGNRLLADEGAGLHAIDLLKEKLIYENAHAAIDVDLVEAGTPGMNLLHQFDQREKIIFIDAGNCGMKPGEYIRFLPEEVKSRKKSKNDSYSLHQFDLITFLEFAGSMGMTGEVEVVIYCIQAAEITMSETLSPAVARGLSFLARDVYNEIKKGKRKITPGMDIAANL